jgi:Glyoxalase-like domain
VSNYILAALLACSPMIAEQLHIDHVTVAGRDLRAMQQALQAAGLPAEYGGAHSNHATEMALTSFPDGSYLELIAIQPHADPAAVAAHTWSKFLEGDAGPCAWATRVSTIPANDKPLKNGRKRPDGVQLEWETAQIGPGNGTFFPFLIHDFTPRDLRAYPSGKPTTTKFTGIVKVYIAVKNLDAAIAEYQRAYKLAAPERTDDAAFGAKLASFKGTPVVLAAPLGESWLVERLQRFGEAPCAFVLGRSKPAQEITWLHPGWHLGVQ